MKNQTNVTSTLSELADLVVQIERSHVLDVEIDEPENDDFQREIHSIYDLHNSELQSFLRFSVETLKINWPPEKRLQFEMLKTQWRDFYAQRPN